MKISKRIISIVMMATVVLGSIVPAFAKNITLKKGDIKKYEAYLKKNHVIKVKGKSTITVLEGVQINGTTEEEFDYKKKNYYTENKSEYENVESEVTNVYKDGKLVIISRGEEKEIDDYEYKEKDTVYGTIDSCLRYVYKNNIKGKVKGNTLTFKKIKLSLLNTDSATVYCDLTLKKSKGTYLPVKFKLYGEMGNESKVDIVVDKISFGKKTDLLK